MALRPTDFTTTPLTKNLAGFKQATRDITNLFSNIAREKNVAQALTEVDAVGEDGQPVLEKRGTFTASDRAFNAASVNAYKAAISNDALENISRIQDENSADPEAFQKSLSEYTAGLLSSVDPSARNEVTQLVDNLGTKARIRVSKNFRDNAEKENAATIKANQMAIKKEITLTNDELKKAIRDGDDAAVQNGLETISSLVAGITDTAEAEEILQGINQATFLENETASIINDIEQNNRLGAVAGLEAARLATPPEGVSLEEWDKHLDGITSEVGQIVKLRKDARDAEQAEFSAANALKLSDLMTLTDQGLVSRENLEQAFENGVIPNTGKLIQLDQARIKALEIGVQKQKVIDRTNGVQGEVLDSTAVNKFYNEDISEGTIAEKTRYVDQVKMVPTQLRAEIDTQLLSGETDLVVQAAAAIDAIDQVPGLEQPFSNNSRAYANWIVKLSKNMTPREAVKEATQLTDPRNKARIESRETEFQELLTKSFGGVDLSVDDVIERGFFNTNIPPSALNKGNMQAEYTDQVKALFLANMDIDDAKEKAAKIIQRNWKDQSFMGKDEAFKYPLADYYAVEGSIKYAEKQLLNDVTTENFFAKPVTKEEIFLLSDKRTADEASTGQPSYLVYFIQDGKFEQIGARWRPDVNEARKTRDKGLMELRKKSGTPDNSAILQADFGAF